MTNRNADEYAEARLGIYFPGHPKSLTGQCVSLAKWFIGDMCGVSDWQSARGHAKDFGDTLVAQGLATEVKNPIRGDLAVYKSGKYGHVGVVLSGNRLFEENANIAGTPILTLDTDGNGSPDTTVFASRISPLYANWRGQAIFYRLNGYNEINGGKEMVTTAEQMDAIYLAVLHRPRGAGEGEDVYLGKDSGFVFNDLYASAERAVRLSGEQQSINELNGKVGELANANLALDNELKKSAELLTTAKTEIERLNTELSTMVKPVEKTIGELFTELVNKILGKA